MSTASATTSLPAPSTADAPDWQIAPQQVILGLILLFELAVFGALGENFLTLNNFLTVTTQNVALGLLALALTPVILTGGIDLSVGSLMGLSAVVFGMLWRDAGLSPITAAMITLLVATFCGGINAVLITRGKIPPLIVTLGTFSMYRGIAEGITAGQGSYTHFPDSFLFLGKGTILGVPAPIWILAPVAVFFYLLVHRSTVGRAPRRCSCRRGRRR